MVREQQRETPLVSFSTIPPIEAQEMPPTSSQIMVVSI